MQKTILALSTAILTLGNVNAQEGKPSAKIFSNFNYDMSAVDTEHAYKAFEIKRAYLGYNYSFDNNLSAKITFDVGADDVSVYTAYLKIAALSWKATDKLTVNFGQVGTNNFKFQEKAWGKRYIAKSAQDQQKWASAADAGLTADYKLSEKLSIDAQVLNGEGYKKAQGKNGLFRGGLGLTYTMSESLALRVNRDINPRASYGTDDASQHITALAITYSGNNFNLGADKSVMTNAGNQIDVNKDLLSVYGTYNLNEKYALFGRYDDVASEEEWDIENDGNFTVFGLERQMAKGVKLAINIQSWTGAEENAEAKRTLFMNLEYKF